MIIGITLLYCALVYLAFRIVKIPVRPVSVAVAVVIGVLTIGAIVIGWQGSAPVTKQITLTRYVVQLVPDVKGQIKKIHVGTEVPVKKGDLLFEIEPAPFQYPVDQYTAQLAAAREKVAELEAATEVAAATVARYQAEAAAAEAESNTAAGIQKDNKGAIAALKVTEAKLKYQAAQAAVEESLASQKQAQFALAAAKHDIDNIQALLEAAAFNLEQTTYEAPTDGYVMNWQAREQTMTTRLRATAVGSFMDMSDTRIVAVYPQNLLRNAVLEDTVEVAFKSTPGRVWSGKVLRLSKYTGEGQLAPEGTLPEAASVGSKGFLTATVRLDDEAGAKGLPLGAAGAVALYTESGDPFHVISKIYLRMIAFTYYLPF